MTKSHTGEPAHWKPIHIQSGRAKGSIICFPCSQKFMSDGLAIGAYPLPARFLSEAHQGDGGLEPGIADHFQFFFFFAILKKPNAVFFFFNEIDDWAPGWSRL